MKEAAYGRFLFKEISMTKKLYYYAFAFTWTSNGQNFTASVYIGYPERLVTVPRIQEAKRQAEAPSDAVMIELSYMGYMTPEVAKGEDHAK